MQSPRPSSLPFALNFVDHECYATRDAATKSIGDYIDNFYKVERRHSLLGYLNPIEFELRSRVQQQVA